MNRARALPGSFRPLFARLLGLVLAAASLGLVAGCASEDLETIYGRRSGIGATSVNGTSVLADMFTAAGHRVTSQTALSDRLQSVDTIVWFPNDFAAPSNEVCNWFDNWLTAENDRTLIYVGRDFDAAPRYWQKVLPNAPAAQRQLITDRLLASRAKLESFRESCKDNTQCDWFEIEDQPKRTVRRLSGPWAAGVEADKVEIELQRRLVPQRGEPLLRSGQDAVVSLVETGECRIVLVANGSFLLNLALVNHEHRKLAGHLIHSVGRPGHVVFLESGPGGPPLAPPPELTTGLRIFAVWPWNAILLQLAAVGIMFGFARLAIFGRPCDPKPTPAADFGRHVEALGKLLQKTRDRRFALARLERYRTLTKEHHVRR